MVFLCGSSCWLTVFGKLWPLLKELLFGCDAKALKRDLSSKVKLICYSECKACIFILSAGTISATGTMYQVGHKWKMRVHFAFCEATWSPRRGTWNKHRRTIGFRIPVIFLGRSISSLLSPRLQFKSLGSLLTVRLHTGLNYLDSKQWNLFFPAWTHSELLGSILLYGVNSLPSTAAVGNTKRSVWLCCRLKFSCFILRFNGWEVEIVTYFLRWYVVVQSLDKCL